MSEWEEKLGMKLRWKLIKSVLVVSSHIALSKSLLTRLKLVQKTLNRVRRSSSEEEEAERENFEGFQLS